MQLTIIDADKAILELDRREATLIKSLIAPYLGPTDEERLVGTMLRNTLDSFAEPRNLE